MRAASLEQSSKDASPVFVAAGRHRSHAVRLAAATLGLLLAGWLAALAAGLIGFSPLPELTLPRTGTTETSPRLPTQGPPTARERDAGANTSAITLRPASGGGQVNPDANAGGRSAPGASGGTARIAQGQVEGEGGGTASTSPSSGAGTPQAPAHGGGSATPADPGQTPSFTPPASGEQSASPPQGNSGAAPGSTISADPPSKATPPRSG